jgi:hypothetical protein
MAVCCYCKGLKLLCAIYRVGLPSLPHSDVRLFLYIFMQRTRKSRQYILLKVVPSTAVDGSRQARPVLSHLEIFAVRAFGCCVDDNNEFSSLRVE